jgi:hypothetical protein
VEILKAKPLTAWAQSTQSVRLGLVFCFSDHGDAFSGKFFFPIFASSASFAVKRFCFATSVSIGG